MEESGARSEILESAFAGQLAACAHGFAQLARKDILTRDLNEEGFRRVLVAFIARLRCYRGYATGGIPPANANPDWDRALLATLDSVHVEQKSVAFIADIVGGRITDVDAEGPDRGTAATSADLGRGGEVCRGYGILPFRTLAISQ